MKKNALVVVVVAIVLVGAFLDSSQSAQAQIGPPPPSCDNLCRNRLYNYYCGGGPCVQFTYLTCMLCNPDLYGGTLQCVTSPGGTSQKCISNGKANAFFYYTSCTSPCTVCTSAVEAVMTGQQEGGNNIDWFTCGGL